MAYANKTLFQKRNQNNGRTRDGYTPQPQDAKWSCTLCGKKPVDQRESGEPRARRESFRSKAELEHHIRRDHREG